MSLWKNAFNQEFGSTQCTDTLLEYLTTGVILLFDYIIFYSLMRSNTTRFK